MTDNALTLGVADVTPLPQLKGFAKIVDQSWVSMPRLIPLSRELEL